MTKIEEELRARVLQRRRVQKFKGKEERVQK